MIYFRNLHEEIFDRYPKTADKLYILSGYVGPTPVIELARLPFESEVIYGLFRENQSQTLHDQFIKLHMQKTQILYANTLSHSKCYMWFEKNKPVRGLIGSANFTSNGLNSDYRECLYEVNVKDLPMMRGYIDIIRDTSTPCIDFTLSKSITDSSKVSDVDYIPGVAKLLLYDPKTGEVQNSAGLNWGMAPTSHVSKNDAYLPIRTYDISHHPDLFPPKAPIPNNPRGSLDDVVELLWDDGTSMQVKLEGSQKFDNAKYPKQISSFPAKSVLGKYLRLRIGVPEGQRVQRTDLIRYGKDHILISKLEDGLYKADFSNS